MISELCFNRKNKLKGNNISFRSEDQQLIQTFKDTCRKYLDRNLEWFHQCDTLGFQMFEFWMGTEEEVLAECRKIAGVMGIELIIN